MLYLAEEKETHPVVHKWPDHAQDNGVGSKHGRPHRHKKPVWQRWPVCQIPLEIEQEMNSRRELKK